ncbi:trimethylamine-N-oxide reductase (cytochrome c) [Rhodobium orientis]|uniref:trimethylamine-N-oxide reductase n=1 Tax=Rhodobium orientis TaxID=34017 RepID=A0A327JS17_9HYPH|nr:trimethylamine-N-oxide reductase TorA [Rhodobium orientis]MBB4302936.1 trimethylamine-N-oxide reductase (cytochrome c) [Rhodobium orientis]MBK5949497.1 trimethylamine-N-oxide reductase TorA [Rhodobium orientis]RAI29290.1 trimethylamine-N-oxide reductase TorA [Rhodobium orientis]
MTSHPITQVSRRSVLKGLTALGAGTLLVPSVLRQAYAAAVADGEVVTGSHFGVHYAKVEGGKLVAVRPHEADLVPVEQATTLVDWAYSPTRIKYPMVRKGFLKDGVNSDRTERGKGEFVRVSWDEALDLVASELKRVKDEHGNGSIYGGSYGWRTPAMLHNCFNNLYRLLNLNGGFVDDVNTYSTGAIRVILPYVIGTSYYDSSTWPSIIENTEQIVFWGSDPAVTSRIGWSVPNHAGLKYLEEYKATGKPSISVNPINTETAKLLGSDWVAPRPGTDVAMMLGIAHTLVAEDLHDTEFLANYCSGFEEFSAYLKGEPDGTEKTAEWAAEICGVDADKLKEMARSMAAKRTLITMGWSIQRQDHGEQGPWMAHTLACMLGYIGLPGGGADFTLHYASYGTPKGHGPSFAGFPAGEASKEVPAPIPCSRVPWALANAGEKYDYNGQEYTTPDLRLVIWAGGNPFHHHQERNKQIDFWQKPETIIISDINWTQSARFADIVLPISTLFERNDICNISEQNAGLCAMQQAIEPLFESKTDFWVYSQVAKRLGFEAEYTDGMDEMGWLKHIYEEGVAKAAEKGIESPDFDTFWNEKKVWMYDVTDEKRNYVQFAKFREDPLLNPVATPSGMFEILSRKIAGYGYDDCPGHPTWMEPFERLGGTMSDKYPLHMTSSHPDYRLHSQLDNADLRHSYEVENREPVWIHPDAAEARGIADGDVVRIFNDRGAVLAGAVVTDRMKSDVIRLQEGAWYDPAEPGTKGALCKHGDPNVLTFDKGTSKLAQGNCAHTALVEIEKYAGDLPTITTFDPVA